MSREEAIKVLSDLHDQCCEVSNIFCTLDSDARCEAVEMAIKALEREPCGNCVNKNILKAQMEYYGFHAPDMTITEFAEDLFSSCKPEPCKDVEVQRKRILKEFCLDIQKIRKHVSDFSDLLDENDQKSCEDAVSRVDVLECFSDLYDTFEDCSKGIVNELHRKFEDLRTLPSVTPKSQEYKTDHGYMWICPDCGLAVHSDFKKCVRCGYKRSKS